MQQPQQSKTVADRRWNETEERAKCATILTSKMKSKMWLLKVGGIPPAGDGIVPAHFPLVAYECSVAPHLQFHLVCSLFHFRDLNRCIVVAHCGFKLYFPSG